MKLKPIVAFALVISLTSYGDTFRKFHDTTGREIKACLRSYNPRTNTVKVELENKSIKTVKASIFSEEDQVYIQDWHIANALFSGSTLRLSANKKTLTSDTYHEERDGWHSIAPGMKFKDIAFELNVENRSNHVLTNVYVEYCIYHQSTIDETYMEFEYISDLDITNSVSGKKRPSKVVNNTIYGTWIIPELSRDAMDQLTKMVKLRRGREFKSEERFAISRNVDDKLLGIRARLYVPMECGEKIMKEFFFPDSLRKTTEWVFPKTISDSYMKGVPALGKAPEVPSSINSTDGYAKVSCEDPFIRFVSGGDVNITQPSITYVEVPEKFAGWLVSATKTSPYRPLKFKVEKSGTVAILLHPTARDAIDLTEWTLVETIRLSSSSSVIICEKEMNAGEYVFAAKKEAAVGIRLLKKN